MNLLEEIEKLTDHYSEPGSNKSKIVKQIESVLGQTTIIEDQSGGSLPSFIHFAIADEEYELIYDQDTHGNLYAVVQPYVVDATD